MKWIWDLFRKVGTKTYGEYLAGVLKKAEQVDDLPLYRISKSEAYSLAFRLGRAEDEEKENN